MDGFSTVPRKSKQFLDIIYDPQKEPSPRAAIADLIFVHGLGSCSRGAWTYEPNDAFWPEWLAEEEGLTDVRISTFGYLSDWKEFYKATNTLGIDGFAKQLLFALDSIRKKDPVRTIQFSCICADEW